MKRHLGHLPFGFKPNSRSDLHQYWRSLDDDGNSDNAPSKYLKNPERSEFLVELFRKHVPEEASILEIGCNVGRNLRYLFESGYRNLTGIEINPHAVKILRETSPEMAREITVETGPVEDWIKNVPDDTFDIVYTMAVLIHVHTSSEWIFAEMRRISKKFIITIEDEVNLGGRHVPRNYKKIFEGQGMREVDRYLDGVPGLESCYVARVFN